MLNLDAGGNLLRLQFQLTHRGVVLQGKVPGFVFEAAAIAEEGIGHVDIFVQAYAHNRLELPQGKGDGVVAVVEIRHRIGNRSLSTGEVQFRSSGHIVLLFREFTVCHGVVVNILVNLVRFLGEKHAVIGLFYLIHGFQTAAARFFYCKLNIFAADFKALP